MSSRKGENLKKNQLKEEILLKKQNTNKKRNQKIILDVK